MFGTKLCCILLPVDIRGAEEGRKEETVADLGATSALAEQTGSESLVEQEMPQLLHAGSVTFWCVVEYLRNLSRCGFKVG